MTDALQPHLEAAIRGARRVQLDYWHANVIAHRGHATFRVHDSAYDRTFGFVCSCTGVEQAFNVPITTLQDMLPEARAAFQRVWTRLGKVGTKKLRREAQKADFRARALLFRHLSREQRWSMRASKAFTVTGQDGRKYLVTEGRGNNVRMLVNGVPTYSLCVVTQDGQIPVYDLLLAQKVLLENDVATFLKTARVMDLRTKYQHATGEFLLQGDDPPDAMFNVEAPPPPHLDVPHLNLPNDILDAPLAWVRNTIGEPT